MKSLVVVLLVLLATPFLHAQEPADPYRAAIDKGIAWLAKTQAADGSWSGKSGLTTAMTAFAGMVLLADGHTLTEGKHAGRLRSAMNWYFQVQLKEIRHTGVLGDLDNSTRYMPEHGVALSFLSQLYTEAEHADDRAPLRDRLRQAIAFSVAGQASNGGWFYSSTIEGHDASENVATAIQLQGLLDARNAGFSVPARTTKLAHECLRKSTTKKGGIAYSRSNREEPPAGGERPTITAMALAAYLPTDDGSLTNTRGWLAYMAEQRIVRVEKLKDTPDLLSHYYLSRAVFHLTDAQCQAAFPNDPRPDHLNWKNYRKALFDHLKETQSEDGSWPARVWGPDRVFNTCLALNILLYEQSHSFRLSR